MSSFVCNGWTIFFYPLFNERWVELSNRVRVLKSQLSKEELITHLDVKLLKALDIGIKEKIPQDPFAWYFVLQKPLHKYSRLKKFLSLVVSVHKSSVRSIYSNFRVNKTHCKGKQLFAPTIMGNTALYPQIVYVRSLAINCWHLCRKFSTSE